MPVNQQKQPAREGLKDLNFFNLLSVRDKAARDAKGRLIKKEGEAVAPLRMYLLIMNIQV